METIIMNGCEYQQSIEDGKKILTRDKNGFKIKMILSGTQEDVDSFKRFVVDIVSKNY